MKKSIKSFMAIALASAMALSSVALGVGGTTAEAASKKQNVITKATYNDGDTVKYSYNKKGLITKSVSTNTSKDSDSDTSTKVTTTYKYNKKNKISSKTAKTVTTVKYYNTDKTTGLTITGNKGTVTTTKTEVTKFTYNKKGLATQSETTTTTTMAGSITSTRKTSYLRNGDLEDDNSNFEVSGVGILAGYNSRNADGSKNYENTSANAYYYTGAVDAAISTTTSTTTYADNGDGTYKCTYSSSTDTPGYKTEETATYYRQEWNDGVLTVVPLTKTEEKDSNGNTTTTYKKADGTTYYGYDFSIISAVTVVADPTATNVSARNNEEIITDKTIATTKYSYDKKKRVKKAVTTTVETDGKNTTNTWSSDSKSATSTSKSDGSNKTESLTEETTVSTTTYSYDKKGRAKKIVVSDNGLVNRKETYNEIPIKSNYESASYDSAGKLSYSRKDYSEYIALPAVYATTTVTEVVNGAATTTITNYPYTRKYINGNMWSESNGYEDAGTEVVTFYTNGGRKTEDTSTYTSYGSDYEPGNYDSETGTSTPGKNYKYVQTTTGKTTNYVFDENSKASGDVFEGSTGTIVRTYEDGTTSSSEIKNSASSSYSEYGKSDKSGVDATVAIDAAKAALAEGNFAKVETDTLLAAPSKKTTTYAYDKNGNVKSAKASGTWTDITTVLNEDYGTKVYVFKANNKLDELKTAVTHKYTDKDAMENTVKKGTKNLTKVYTISTGTSDRVKSSSSWIDRAVYTIKSKKASAASVAKKQQWNIQNIKDETLNGQVGLN